MEAFNYLGLCSNDVVSAIVSMEGTFCLGVNSSCFSVKKNSICQTTKNFKYGRRHPKSLKCRVRSTTLVSIRNQQPHTWRTGTESNTGSKDVVDWFPMPPVPTGCMIIYAQFHFFISKFLFGKGQILDSHKNSTMILIWFKNETRQECPQVFGPCYFLIRVYPYQS